mgnify:CR=1 FL=1
MHVNSYARTCLCIEKKKKNVHKNKYVTQTTSKNYCLVIKNKKRSTKFNFINFNETGIILYNLHHTTGWFRKWVGFFIF